jgi:hypothetical protein
MKKDTLLTGVCLGLIAPVVSVLISQYTSLQQTLFAQKPIGLFVLAGAINLILLRILYKKGMDNAGRAVMLITFIGLLIVLYTHKLSL